MEPPPIHSSDKQHFKSIVSGVVSQCFPEERLAFDECSDGLIDDVFDEHDLSTQSGPIGEFKWVEELKAAAEGGQYALQFVTAMVAIYKLWAELRPSISPEKREQLLTNLRTKLKVAGMKSSHIEKAAQVALEEATRTFSGK